MPNPRVLRALLTVGALTLVAIVAACSGDDILAPADGVACTQGRLRSGEAVESAITVGDCLRFNPYWFDERWGESWTLDARANAFYIVRLTPRPNAQGANTWNGDLNAFVRNAQGDPEFVTGYWRSFGPGDRGREMYLYAERDQQISIRVDVGVATDTGAYRLEVQRCAVRDLPHGTLQEEVVITDACRALAFDAVGEARVTLLSYAVETAGQYLIELTRTGGTGAYRSTISGPGLDVAAYQNESSWTDGAPSTTTRALNLYAKRAGRYTLILASHPDSAPILSVRAVVPALAE